MSDVQLRTKAWFGDEPLPKGTAAKQLTAVFSQASDSRFTAAPLKRITLADVTSELRGPDVILRIAQRRDRPSAAE